MISIIVVIGLAVLTAVTGSMLTNSGLSGWYQSLTLPTWTPPGAVIGTVWTVIYILTAIAAIYVWKRFQRGPRFNAIIVFFLLNAALNVLWSAIFFRWHLLGVAVLESSLLGASVIVLMALTWSISRIPALLLAPYILWVSFATYLAYTIWRLNS